MSGQNNPDNKQSNNMNQQQKGNSRVAKSRAYGNPFVIALGKAVRGLARVRGGSGSAIPGVVVDKVAPDFAPRVLGALPYGVVVVSGTNGKTTTTKIVTELLESQGLKVFTNSSGSNFMRGVIASLLSEITVGGRLEADIAVLELDEAHAVHFVKRVAPRYSLLLNVMPDQLDRFGTVEYTASLLRQVAERTTGTVVLNREDAQLSLFGTQSDKADISEASGADTNSLIARVCRFGLGEQIRDRFLTAIGAAEKATDNNGFESLPATVLLTSMEGKDVSYEIIGDTFNASLVLKGLHNAYNGAGAIALVREIMADGAKLKEGQNPQDTDRSKECDRKLVAALTKIESAFGRGESFVFNGREIEMLLVKNAGGFSLALESFDSEECLVMIVANDEVGDGRDVSWLYDVDFTLLKDNEVVMLSGSRAYDMALRLQYDEVPYQNVVLDPITALDQVLTGAKDAGNSTNPRPLHIFCTYTAMMRVRPRLIALTGVGSTTRVAATDSLSTGKKQVN